MRPPLRASVLPVLALMLGLACGTSDSPPGSGTGATGGSAGRGNAEGGPTGGFDNGGGGSAMADANAGAGGESINCALAGCAAPPLCSTGCLAICGCCTCSEGQISGSLVCTGGCWDLLPEGGTAADGATSAEAATSGCTYGGTQYAVDAVFPVGDGCNTCTCHQDGSVVCTALVCKCDPEAEKHRREYKRTSVEMCAGLRYVCPENTATFENECGCGCEQDADCPEWFNCEPSPGAPPCDKEALATKCPYSGFAF